MSMTASAAFFFQMLRSDLGCIPNCQVVGRLPWAEAVSLCRLGLAVAPFHPPVTHPSGRSQSQALLASAGVRGAHLWLWMPCFGQLAAILRNSMMKGLLRIVISANFWGAACHPVLF